MNTRRVVITGLGVIAPNGVGKEAFWSSLAAGRSGVRLISRFDSSPLPTRFAGEVNGLSLDRYLDFKQARRMDRTSHFAVAAAKMAAEDAALKIEQEDSNRIGVIVGTALAGHGFILEQHDVYRDRGPMSISPYTAIASFPDACSGQISIALELHGHSFTMSTACSSSSDTIGQAVRSIRHGEWDLAIAGGSEAPIFPPIMASFCVMRALSTRNEAPERASRPFDKGRDGFVVGEGAGMLVVEDYEHAVRRGAHIYAEILGFGLSCDAYHMTAPEPTGQYAARAIQMALDSSGVWPTDIDYINAHGTSTPLNDKTETAVIKKVFGDHARRVPISATKSMIGHLIGAAGSVELIASVLAMEHQIIPPTINLETPDPECDLDYVPNAARPAKIRTLLKNSFGFGGKNSALVLRKFTRN